MFWFLYTNESIRDFSKTFYVSVKRDIVVNLIVILKNLFSTYTGDLDGYLDTNKLKNKIINYKIRFILC